MNYLTWFLCLFACPTPPSPAPVQESAQISTRVYDQKNRYKLIPDGTFTKKEADDEALVEDKIEEMLHSTCFVQTLLIDRTKVLRTAGRTRAEVLKHLWESGTAVKVTLYRKNNNVIGYRIPGQNVIHANRKYFDRASICGKASNHLHEIAHILGYSHDFNYTKDRAYSVPYTLNYAVEKCCK